jgi:chromosome partitioning protein
MPTIAFASSKGGVGKTTSALTLAFVLAQHGAPTTLIDADPNQPIHNWSTRFPDEIPENLHPVTAGESMIARVIDTAAAKDPFVLIDLEGTASLSVSVAMGRSDLVLIPMQGSQLDADEAAKIIRLIASQEDNWRRKIPFRVFFTRTSPAIESKGMRDIIEQLTSGGIPTMKTTLVEREAYRVPFRMGRGLYSLTPGDVRNPRTAIENAEAFAQEVRQILLDQPGVESSAA